MEPADVMAEYGRAWAEGRPEDAWEFYADTVVMRLPGRGPLAGEHVGRQAVIAAIQRLLERAEDQSAEVEVLDRLVSDNRVAMLVREVVVRGSHRLELFRVNLYRIEHDKITQIDIFEANQYEVDEFFA